MHSTPANKYFQPKIWQKLAGGREGGRWGRIRRPRLSSRTEFAPPGLLAQYSLASQSNHFSYFSYASQSNHFSYSAIFATQSANEQGNSGIQSGYKYAPLQGAYKPDPKYQPGSEQVEWKCKNPSILTKSEPSRLELGKSILDLVFMHPGGMHTANSSLLFF